MKKKLVIIIGAVVVAALIIFFLIQKNYSQKEDFSINTNTILLKLTIPIGGESETAVKITNEEKEQEFDVSFVSLAGIGSLNEKSFTLAKGETKDIKLFFKDTKNEAKIYAGQLVIKSSNSEKKIPIILNVEDRNSEFAIIQEIIPKYEDVYPGGKFGVKIKIYNVENNDLYSVMAVYSIKNLNDEIISSEEESLVVQGNIELNKIIDIPSTLPQGNYIFITSLDSEGVKTSAGQLFSVSNQTESGSLFDNFNFFVAVILIFLAGILALFFYFMKTRDDLLIQLKKQQSGELKRNLELIEAARREAGRLRKPERKRRIVSIKKAKKKIIRKIKARQKRQIVVFKKLKKSGKKQEAVNMMKKWEKEGYAMPELKKEKTIPISNIKNQIENWKKEGYKTGVLNK